MAESKLRDISTDFAVKKHLFNQCGTIRKILISSINTAKMNST